MISFKKQKPTLADHSTYDENSVITEDKILTKKKQ